jgi:hypothetical protein
MNRCIPTPTGIIYNAVSWSPPLPKSRLINVFEARTGGRFAAFPFIPLFFYAML